MKTKRILLDTELAPVVQELFQTAGMEVDVVTPRKGLLEPLVEHGKYAALLVQSKTPVPLSVLEAAGKSLKVIGVVGDSIANINIADASRHGILLKGSNYANSYEAANLTLRLMVVLLSKSFRNREESGAKILTETQICQPEELTGFELAGKTVGLIGCGRVAQSLALEIKPYCDRIIGYDNHLRAVFETFHRRSPLEKPVIEYCQLSDVLEHSDVISIHTAGMDRVFKGKELFYARKKPYIINTSRRGNMDEAALLDALREKRVRGVGLSLPADQVRKNVFDEWVRPFLALQNVAIAPATGKATTEMKKKRAKRLAQSIIDFLQDKDLSLSVNPMDIVLWSRKEQYPVARGDRRGAVPILLGQ